MVNHHLSSPPFGEKNCPQASSNMQIQVCLGDDVLDIVHVSKQKTP